MPGPAHSALALAATIAVVQAWSRLLASRAGASWLRDTTAPGSAYTVVDPFHTVTPFGMVNLW